MRPFAEPPAIHAPPAAPAAARRRVWIAVCLAGPAVVVPWSAADDEPGKSLRAAAWKLEAIELRDGRRLEGLITAPPPGADADADVTFVQVVRRPGRPTFMVTWGPLAGERVAAFDRLPPAEHERLAGRIRGLRDDKARRADLEQSIELSRADDAAPWRHVADEFVLESTTDPGITREAALRLTQLFGALANLVPPAVPAGPPTTIRLCGSHAEYLAEQQALGIRVANPAFFVPARRLIVAGSDMPVVVAEWRAAAAANAAAARRLVELDRDLNPRLKQLAADLEKQGMAPGGRAEVVQKARNRWQRERAAEQARIEAADRKNENRVAAARRDFYGRLAHEAWHAYAASRLRPAAGHGLPPWLDEGLAQVLESAPLEAGELRLDAADPSRLTALQALLREGRAPPLAAVLRAGGDRFIAGHASAAEDPSHAYLVAWGLAFDLAVTQPLLAPQAVVALGQGGDGDEVARFERLVGVPLETFEPQWRRRMAALRPSAAAAVSPAP